MKVVDRHIFYLGTSESRDAFLTTHPDLFHYGLQVSGGRIQMVTLDVDRLIKEHSEQLIDWLYGSLSGITGGQRGAGSKHCHIYS